MSGEAGEILGAPPSIEWVDIKRLLIDASYQRLTDGPKSKRIIKQMVKCWDWRLCQPLVVARRPNGDLMVIDGQHRLAGVKERGDILHLPCVISAIDDAKTEASSFVKLNTHRQKLSQFDIFMASIQAGDADALLIMKMIDEAGLTLVRHNNTASWKPRQIYSAPALQKMLSTHGAANIEKSLRVFARGYPDTVVSACATLLKGLIFLHRDHCEEIKPAQLAAALASVDADSWRDEITMKSAQNPLWSRTECTVECILDVYELQKAEAA